MEAKSELSVLITACPLRGHVMPLVTVGLELAARGHRVRVMTGAKFRPVVERAGLEFVPLPAAADFDDEDLAGSFPGEDVLQRGLAGLRISLRLVFLERTPAQVQAVSADIAARGTDVILTDPLFFGSVALAQRPGSERPVVVACAVTPLPVPGRATPPFGLGLLPRAGLVGRLRDAVLQQVVQRSVLTPLQPAVRTNLDPWFDPPASAGSMMEIFAATDHSALLFPAALDHPVRPLTDPRFAYYGPIATPPSGTADADLPDWWPDLTAGRPVVHVTQGTVDNKDFSRVLVPTLRALADKPVLVVAALGGRALSALDGVDLPGNVRVASFLPYDRLLPLTSVVVTNGGLGGVQQALAHGIPVVAIGSGQDKPEVIARVRSSGAGLGVPRSTASPRWIRAAVLRSLTDPTLRAGAAAMAAAMAAAPGLAVLERRLVELVADARAVPLPG